MINVEARELITLEKAMLAYASFGKIRDNQNRYPYFMNKFNCAHIRENLIKTGFLELATYLQTIPYYPYRDLQQLLKQRHYPCGNSKFNVIENAKEYLKESDLKEYFGYRCYIPTILSEGKYETDIDYYFADLQLDKLQTIDEECYKYYLLKDAFKEMHIETINPSNKSYIVTEADDILSLYEYNESPINSNIKLFIDTTYLCKINNINEVYFFEDEQQILFIRNTENKEYLCKRYDIKSKAFLPELKFVESPWNYLGRHDLDSLNKFDNGEIIRENTKEQLENERIIENMLEKQKGVFDSDGSIIYYFSASNPIVQIIVENYIGNLAGVSIMKPLFTEDFSKKYKVKISNNDTETECLLLWLFIDKQITPPEISGIPISCFCNDTKDIRAKKKYTNYKFVKNKLHFDRKNKLDIISELNENFPVKILIDEEYYTAYRGLSGSKKQQYYFHVYKHEKEYAEKYKQIYLTLQEQGIIPTKWKSEFELYMLVKSYFEDTIYQYHNEWLGLQSLDIFIPQINLGIEYQGIQHYQAVELFGGEEGYITRQKRDKIKKEKCKQENVKLLYWDYRVQISDTNLEELLNSIGINLPPKKVNVSYTPYEKQ